MQTDPDYDVPCSEACDAYKDAIAPPVFTLFDVISCDHCKKPMFPNVSTHDEDGMAWNCTTPGCGDFTGDEIEAEDLIACGCPPWIAKRMNALSDACGDLMDRIAELEAEALEQTEIAREALKRAEQAEAELKAAKHLNAKWMDERTTALMDKEKAEAALAESEENHRQAMIAVGELSDDLAERDRMLEDLNPWYAKRARAKWLAYLKARAEEGSRDAT